MRKTRLNSPPTKEDFERLLKTIEGLVTKKEVGKLRKKFSKDLKLGLKGLELTMNNRLATEIDKLNGKIDEVEERLNRKIDGVERAMRASWHLDIEDAKKELEEKISRLPTKEEFFSNMDKLMKELETMRQENTIGFAQLSNLRERLEVVEEKIGITPL